MNRQSQWLFESPFVLEVGTEHYSKSTRSKAGKCMCRRCQGKAMLRAKPNAEAEWLFEAPPILESDRTTNFELEIDWEAPTVVFKSKLFLQQGDERLRNAANNKPAFSYGEKGRAVETLQKALVHLGYPMPITMKKGTPDGIYGDETYNTIKTFQRQHPPLKIDGIAGKNTLQSLDQLLPQQSYIPPGPGIQPTPQTPPPLPLPTPPSTPSPGSVELTRVCCMLAPVKGTFWGLRSSFVDPQQLGNHGDTWWGGKEALGIIYTGKAGFLDLAHIRDTCDQTRYVYKQIEAVKGMPVIIQTFHGTATINKPIPPSYWLQVAREISYDDSFAYEIATYDDYVPGGHNSSFSPEDLVSNYLGTLLAERAIKAGGDFNTAVTNELTKMLASLNPQTPLESERAFNLINGCWVDFKGSSSLGNNTYLKRRNFDPMPWPAGHPSDGSVPLWVTGGFGSSITTFHTYTYSYPRYQDIYRTNVIIHKADFPNELNRIKQNAALPPPQGYGPRFNDWKCP